MKGLRNSMLAAATLVLAAGFAVAAPDAPPSQGTRVMVRQTPPRGTTVSMDQAVSLVEHVYRARVVRAETQTQGDRTIYVLRVLNEAGRVFSVRVDAASGSIL